MPGMAHDEPASRHALQESRKYPREVGIEPVRIGAGKGRVGGEAKGGGAIQGFEIAGADGKYVAAEAKVDGNTMVVSSAEVPAYYRSKCLTCHTDASCSLPDHGGRCAECHMPKLQLREIPHTALTNHRIPVQQ